MLTRLLVATIFLMLIPTKALAAVDFETAYQAVYTLHEGGMTDVTHTITIKNKLSHIFPRVYTLSLGSENIESLQVKSASGTPLPHELEKSGNISVINLTLQDPVIGQGRANSFTISYRAKDIALHTGQVWEINIPRLKQGGEMSMVERTIIFPKSLGTPTSAIPLPDTTTSDHNSTTLVFRGNQQEAISLLFGESQWYKVGLTYQIQPIANKAAETEISLPPDTPYQQVVISKIDPPPSYITVDQDGNWLARYPASTQTDTAFTVYAELFIKVSPLPIYHDPSTGNLSAYTTDAKYWESKSSIVKQTGERLKTPKNIYNYLVTTLSYNTNRVTPGAERLGAAKALAMPSSAICTEFTDTFVALARSQNIPAREINGYAITSNNELRPLSLETDILHAWPEFFDRETNKWIQIDPTWSSTTGGLDYFSKLDYNHIAFVRHGIEPTYPFPAGVYKSSVDDKTITVELALTEPEINYRPEVTPLKKDNFLIKNQGNFAMVNKLVKLPNNKTYTVDYLPPLGQVETTQVLGVASTKSEIPYALLLVIGTVLTSIILGVVYLIKCKKLFTK